jgi:hypothetical protein
MIDEGRVRRGRADNDRRVMVAVTDPSGVTEWDECCSGQRFDFLKEDNVVMVKKRNDGMRFSDR